jgi:hypothetical protein
MIRVFRQWLRNWSLAILLALLATGCIAHAQSPSSRQRLAATQGATLDRIRLETGGTVYLQTLGLSHC